MIMPVIDAALATEKKNKKARRYALGKLGKEALKVLGLMIAYIFGIIGFIAMINYSKVFIMIVAAILLMDIGAMTVGAILLIIISIRDSYREHIKELMSGLVKSILYQNQFYKYQRLGTN